MTRKFIRFCLSGLVNTAVGYAIVLFLLYVNADPYLANGSGFLAGLVISFFLNKAFTFGRRNQVHRKEVMGYALAFLGAYSVNLLALHFGSHFVSLRNPLLHLLAILSYSISFFLLMGKLAFPERGNADPEET